MLKNIVTLLFFTVIFAGSTRPAFAVTLPDFGSCLNPQTEAAQTNVGTNHGVVGQANPYSGTDKIYKLQNGNVTQCLCTDGGNGIQTNWLKISQLSESEIDSLKLQGWIYIATGSSWGLDDAPYLAKNSDFSCNGSSNGSSGGSTQGASSSNEGKVEAKVLGLASTGSALIIFGFLLAGFTTLIAGLLLNRAKNG